MLPWVSNAWTGAATGFSKANSSPLERTDGPVRRGQLQSAVDGAPLRR